MTRSFISVQTLLEYEILIAKTGSSYVNVLNGSFKGGILFQQETLKLVTIQQQLYHVSLQNHLFAEQHPCNN